jgi:hypothetical protein
VIISTNHANILIPNKAQQENVEGNVSSQALSYKLCFYKD